MNNDFSRATSRPVKAPQGSTLHCKNWLIEAPYRMIQNNLDPDVAERPEDLVVYGGIGKAARNRPCFEAILASLRDLNEDAVGAVRQTGWGIPYAYRCAARADSQL